MRPAVHGKCQVPSVQQADNVGPAAEQHCRHILHATTTRVNPRPGPHQSGREALAGLPRSEGLKALPPRGWQSPPGAAPPADGPPSTPAARRQRPHAGCGRGDISPSTSIGRRRVARLPVQNDIIGIMPDAAGIDGAPLTGAIVSEQCAFPQHPHPPQRPPRTPTNIARARQGKMPAFRAGPPWLGSLHRHGDGRSWSTARRAQQHRHMPAHEFNAMVVEHDGSTDASGTVSAISSRHDRQSRVTPRRVPGGRNRGASPSRPSREWIGGRFSPPFFIHDRAKPYRPDLVLWMELPDGFVVGQAIVVSEDTQGAVARTLRNALTQPAVGSRRACPTASASLTPPPPPKCAPRSQERYPSRSPRRPS